MFKTLLKGGVSGAIILFIWSSISWTVLPWHSTTINHFQSESTVTQVIQANANQSGIYFMPSQYSTSHAQNPMLFAAVRLQGMPSMGSAMLIQFLIQLAGAFLVTYLLMTARLLNYWKKVGFVFVFAIASAIIGELPYWNWFGFSANFILVGIADILIGWFLAGLTIAKIIK